MKAERGLCVAFLTRPGKQTQQIWMQSSRVYVLSISDNTGNSYLCSQIVEEVEVGVGGQWEAGDNYTAVLSGQGAQATWARLSEKP